mmetsp:Transcript_50923/g.135882  ORF Transcript_50923/g.135882 Transcript_50923/m.135882 type:complete len:98 (-) Transcript_50923:249-542(-)
MKWVLAEELAASYSHCESSALPSQARTSVGRYSACVKLLSSGWTFADLTQCVRSEITCEPHLFHVDAGAPGLAVEHVLLRDDRMHLHDSSRAFSCSS